MTRGVGRSKSHTESEQNWFSENKASWLFSLVSYFCVLFMDVPPYLGQTTYESTCVNFFSAILTDTKISESMAKFHEFWWRIALVCPKFLKNISEIVFS